MLRKGDEPIPGYRLERFLGRGAYGEVWRTTAPGGTSAALKFIDLSGQPGVKEWGGVQRVKEIRHAHLMPITALWLLDADGHVLSEEALRSYDPEGRGAQATLNPPAVLEECRPQCLVVAMLLADKSLQDRLHETQAAGQAGIPRDELLGYMEEAAKGIDFLNAPKHDLGDGPVAIQHRDIKPANMMLVGDSVVICDFGLARLLRQASTATAMAGSPAYMAPESIDGKPDRATDQYALAISYHELRTGTLPFQGETYVAVLEAHRNSQLDFSALPPAEAEVLRRATAKTPLDRYPSTVDMVKALRQAAIGTPPVQSGARQDTGHRGRGRGAVVAAAVLLLVGMGTWFGVEGLRRQALSPSRADGEGGDDSPPADTPPAVAQLTEEPPPAAACMTEEPRKQPPSDPPATAAAPPAGEPSGKAAGPQPRSPVSPRPVASLGETRPRGPVSPRPGSSLGETRPVGTDVRPQPTTESGPQRELRDGAWHDFVNLDADAFSQRLEVLRATPAEDAENVGVPTHEQAVQEWAAAQIEHQPPVEAIRRINGLLSRGLRQEPATVRSWLMTQRDRPLQRLCDEGQFPLILDALQAADDERRWHWIVEAHLGLASRAAERDPSAGTAADRARLAQALDDITACQERHGPLAGSQTARYLILDAYRQHVAGADVVSGAVAGRLHQIAASSEYTAQVAAVPKLRALFDRLLDSAVQATRPASTATFRDSPFSAGLTAEDVFAWLTACQRLPPTPAEQAAGRKAAYLALAAFYGAVPKIEEVIRASDPLLTRLGESELDLRVWWVNAQAHAKAYRQQPEQLAHCVAALRGFARLVTATGSGDGKNGRFFSTEDYFDLVLRPAVSLADAWRTAAAKPPPAEVAAVARDAACLYAALATLIDENADPRFLAGAEDSWAYRQQLLRRADELAPDPTYRLRQAELFAERTDAVPERIAFVQEAAELVLQSAAADTDLFFRAQGLMGWVRLSEGDQRLDYQARRESFQAAVKSYETALRETSASPRYAGHLVALSQAHLGLGLTYKFAERKKLSDSLKTAERYAQEAKQCVRPGALARACAQLVNVYQAMAQFDHQADKWDVAERALEEALTGADVRPQGTPEACLLLGRCQYKRALFDAELVVDPARRATKLRAAGSVLRKGAEACPTAADKAANYEWQLRILYELFRDERPQPAKAATASASDTDIERLCGELADVFPESAPEWARCQNQSAMYLARIGRTSAALERARRVLQKAEHTSPPAPLTVPSAEIYEAVRRLADSSDTLDRALPTIELGLQLILAHQPSPRVDLYLLRCGKYLNFYDLKRSPENVLRSAQIWQAKRTAFGDDLAAAAALAAKLDPPQRAQKLASIKALEAWSYAFRFAHEAYRRSDERALDCGEQAIQLFREAIQPIPDRYDLNIDWKLYAATLCRELYRSDQQADRLKQGLEFLKDVQRESLDSFRATIADDYWRRIDELKKAFLSA